MTAMKITCVYCGKATDKSPGHVNRARKTGKSLYCNRRCFGLARRKHVPKSVKRLNKAIYDAAYRKKNRTVLKAKKHDYFMRTYDPDKARIERKKRSAAHAEYCRQPEYKRWKADYDRKRRDDISYGPFAEAARLCIDLNRAIKERMTDEQIRQANGTFNKIQQRRREGKTERSRTRPRFRDRRPSHSAAHGG
jgi:hypothetical protein